MTPTEHQEQAAFVGWWRAQFPRILLYAIPNGNTIGFGGARSGIGLRSAKAAKMKAEGFVAGMPDLHCPEWGLWIEMKRTKGGALSPCQRELIAHLEGIGQSVLVARGCADAIAQVMRWRVTVAA